MHSSWQVWDFFNTHSQVLKPNVQGLYAWYCFDPYISKLVKDSIDSNVNFTTLMAQEISLTWLENNFLSLSLFGNNDSFLIQNAQQLSKECQELILSNSLMLDGRYLILSFNEDCTFFKKVCSQESIESYKIVEPKFWENQKLLEFLADKCRVRLSYPVKQIILERVHNNCGDFINILKSLQINFGLTEISEKMLSEVLVSERLDKFELSTTFSLKKKDQFYQRILESSVSNDTLRDLFYFMQGHLMKVYDPRFLDHKAKLSQYDKKIINFAKSWDKKELEEQIDTFRSLEQLAKLNNPSLIVEIKKQYLASLS